MAKISSILIVEDEIYLGESIKESLEELGHKVWWVRESDSAWNILSTESIDLVLLDIMLPGSEDGYMILKRIRSSVLPCQKVIVVMMTNLGQVGEMDRAMEIGANDYLIKSNIDLERLVQVVAEQLTVIHAKD